VNPNGLDPVIKIMAIGRAGFCDISLLEMIVGSSFIMEFPQGSMPNGKIITAF
jgi:hypothetical protein